MFHTQLVLNCIKNLHIYVKHWYEKLHMYTVFLWKYRSSNRIKFRFYSWTIFFSFQYITGNNISYLTSHWVNIIFHTEILFYVAISVWRISNIYVTFLLGYPLLNFTTHYIPRIKIINNVHTIFLEWILILNYIAGKKIS